MITKEDVSLLVAYFDTLSEVPKTKVGEQNEKTT